MLEVKVDPRPLEALAGILTPEQAKRFRSATDRAAGALSGRVVWNVSSTATGGGVAEMLRTLLGYVTGAGVQTRWLVIAGDPGFFAVTKRLHNAIHGAEGGADLGVAEHQLYERVLERNAAELLRLVGRDDPQTAGLVGPLRAAGAPTVWRSHIGRDAPNDASDRAWGFLRRYVEAADGFVFSRRQYSPAWLPVDKLWVIPPSIDPLSAKNRPIPPEECLDILTRAGLLAGTAATRAGVVQGAPPPTADTRLVVQVSRWDRLKDMAGVLAGFGRLPSAAQDAHLMLVGPAVAGISDDPEGAQVLAECLEAWGSLPPGVRDRVHLASVPMDDPDLNATIVNAVQRHAAVVTQKSIAEGFGLTVAEAMWKAKPVVASAVGGIRDQIVPGRDGLLVDDPHDLDVFAAAVGRVLADDQLAGRLGTAAHQRVQDQFLGDRHLEQYADLFTTLLDG